MFLKREGSGIGSECGERVRKKAGFLGALLPLLGNIVSSIGNAAKVSLNIEANPLALAEKCS